jgi:gliding motility-associated-like protein
MQIRILPILLTLFSVISVRSQPCTILGQTPFTAFPVCGTSTFTQSAVPTCSNDSIPVNCQSTGITYWDLNPYWYKFTCFQSGTLKFIISPKNGSDDYDWQLFDITGRTPGEVYNFDPAVSNAIFVACNWSGVQGNTGTNSSAASLIECASIGFPVGTVPTSPPPFSKAPKLIQGHNYLLMVSHFSGSDQSGYTLSFGGGTASITDTVPPHLKAGTVTCDAKSIRIKLNKKMKCSSIDPAGSDFSLGLASSVILSAEGIGCGTGFDVDSLVVNLDKPLPPGNYTLKAQFGTDLNTILDNCDQNIPVGDSIVFSVIPIMPTPMDSLSPVACAPNSLQLVFKKPINCGSIAADGSDFMVTGPSAIAVTGASGSCDGNNATSSIVLKLAGPVVVGGVYTIQLVNGTDGNTIIDECGQTTPAGSKLIFFTKDTVSAFFSDQVFLGCRSDSIAFTQGGKNGINQWLWTFDTTGTSFLQNPSITFTSFGEKKIRLFVSNGFCQDTASLIINLDNQLKAAFEAPDVLCPKDKAQFINNSIGSVISWNWDFGDGMTSFQQTPSDHSYPNTLITDKNYIVRLIIQNGMGCLDTATREIRELHTCYIAVPNAFTPNGDGLNDWLYPLNAYKAENMEFRVFNRYGQLVFETRDWTRKWDGKIGGVAQPTGTYAWTLQYTEIDSGKKIFLKGTSVLIR